MKSFMKVGIAVIAIVIVTIGIIVTDRQLKTEADKITVSNELVEPAPSNDGVEVESQKETHEELIARLVADVDSGKAGTGDARKEYLGEYYDEVQSVINKRIAEQKKAEEAKKKKQAAKKKSSSSNKKSTNSSSGTAKASGTKAEYQAYAHDLVINSYGWSEADFDALVKLWNHESGWNPNSVNKSSGACGIPQALPCNKIKKQQGSSDWQAQIRWGLNYIRDRKGYGNPSKAWAHFQKYHWY